MRRDKGVLKTGGGHPIRVGRHRTPWPATVTAINPDGTIALHLDHPCGWRDLTYPAIPYSAAHALHSWHLAT